MAKRLWTCGCFYTPEYESIYRENLQSSCERLGVPLTALPMPSRKDWTLNCGLKPGAVLELFDRLAPGAWLLFVDVDAQMRHAPPIDDVPDCLLACHWLERTSREQPELLSGTLLFSPQARELIRTWLSLQDERPNRWDQRNLQDAVQFYTSDDIHRLDCRWTWVMDLEMKVRDLKQPQCPMEEAYIVHGQASRRMKGTIR